MKCDSRQKQKVKINLGVVCMIQLSNAGAHKICSRWTSSVRIAMYTSLCRPSLYFAKVHVELERLVIGNRLSDTLDSGNNILVTASSESVHKSAVLK